MTCMLVPAWCLFLSAKWNNKCKAKTVFVKLINTRIYLQLPLSKRIIYLACVTYSVQVFNLTPSLTPAPDQSRTEVVLMVKAIEGADDYSSVTASC